MRKRKSFAFLPQEDAEMQLYETAAEVEAATWTDMDRYRQTD